MTQVVYQDGFKILLFFIQQWLGLVHEVGPSSGARNGCSSITQAKRAELKFVEFSASPSHRVKSWLFEVALCEIMHIYALFYGF